MKSLFETTERHTDVSALLRNHRIMDDTEATRCEDAQDPARSPARASEQSRSAVIKPYIGDAVIVDLKIAVFRGN